MSETMITLIIIGAIYAIGCVVAYITLLPNRSKVYYGYSESWMPIAHIFAWPMTLVMFLLSIAVRKKMID